MIIEWNHYIKWGEFESTHGTILPFKWEFDRLEHFPQRDDANLIIAAVRCLAYPYEIVGIRSIHPQMLIPYCTSRYDPKTKTFDGIKPKGKYVVYDDAITTGQTICECIREVGRKAEFAICIVDRGNWHYTFDVKTIIDILRD